MKKKKNNNNITRAATVVGNTLNDVRREMTQSVWRCISHLHTWVYWTMKRVTLLTCCLNEAWLVQRPSFSMWPCRFTSLHTEGETDFTFWAHRGLAGNFKANAFSGGFVFEQTFFSDCVSGWWLLRFAAFPQNFTSILHTFHVALLLSSSSLFS